MINAFSINLNTVNLNLKIKPWPYYKIMIVSILKILIVKWSKRLCYVQYSDLGYWYIIWNVNTRERGGRIWKAPFALMPLGVGISYKACGLVASGNARGRGTMYVTL